MKTALRRFLAAASAFALSACMLVGGDSLVTPGGAEDFPNTVNELGRIAVGDISSGTQWQQVQSVQIPEMPSLSGLDSLSVSPPLGKPVLAKLGKAALDTLDFDLWEMDLSPAKQFEAAYLGYVYAYARDSNLTFVRRDTVKALYVGDRNMSGLLDSVRNNPGRWLLPLDYKGAIRHATGVVKSYRLRNLDSRGELDYAEYTTLTPEANGGTHRLRVKIYGADGAVMAANAVPEDYEVLRRNAANDTLEWIWVRDARGGLIRKLWDSTGSGIVNYSMTVRNPPSLPELSRMRVEMRAELRHGSAGDSMKQLSYLEQRWTRTGRVASFSLGGVGTPDGVMLANDSARMIVDTIYALRDSTIRYTAIYNLRIGSAPERMQEHALLGYGISKYWRLGPLFSTVSLFAPTTPLTMGQSGFEGLMSFTAAYVNGDTVVTQGTVTPDSLNLTVRQVKGGAEQSFKVILDAAGKLIRPPEVIAPPSDATATARRAFED